MGKIIMKNNNPISY